MAIIIARPSLEVCSFDIRPVCPLETEYIVRFVFDTTTVTASWRIANLVVRFIVCCVLLVGLTVKGPRNLDFSIMLQIYRR